MDRTGELHVKGSMTGSTDQTSHVFPHVWSYTNKINIHKNACMILYMYICICMSIYIYGEREKREHDYISRPIWGDNGEVGKGKNVSEKYWNLASVYEYNIIQCTVRRAI
jgi:hypothetical protein